MSMCRIQRLGENNILSRLGKNYNKPINKCLTKAADRPKKSKLNLYDLASAFFVLGLGSSLSFLVFLIELILSLRRKRHRRPTMQAATTTVVE